jgi:hypothetical protein
VLFLAHDTCNHMVLLSMRKKRNSIVAGDVTMVICVTFTHQQTTILDICLIKFLLSVSISCSDSAYWALRYVSHVVPGDYMHLVFYQATVYAETFILAVNSLYAY